MRPTCLSDRGFLPIPGCRGRELARMARDPPVRAIRAENEPSRQVERHREREVEGAARRSGKLDAERLGRPRFFLTQANKGGTVSAAWILSGPRRRQATLEDRRPLQGQGAELEPELVLQCVAGHRRRTQRRRQSPDRPTSACYDFAGKELWNRTDLGVREHMFGNGSFADPSRCRRRPVVRASTRRDATSSSRWTRRPARPSWRPTRSAHTPGARRLPPRSPARRKCCSACPRTPRTRS